MKKILIIIITFISIVLIGTGVYLSMNMTLDTSEEEKEEIEYTNPNETTKEFPSISTQDGKITLSKTTVYYREQISAFDVEITSTEAMTELYLLIEFSLEPEKHLRAVYLTNVKANETMKTQIQTEIDLTKATSWAVRTATKDEVIAAGFEI